MTRLARADQTWGPFLVLIRDLSSFQITSRVFSRGEDRCKSGVLADRAGSGVVIHPPSPREVVGHVAGPRCAAFLAPTKTSTTPPRCVSKSLSTALPNH